MIVVTENREYEDFAIAYTLTNESLDRIKGDSRYYLDEEFVRDLHKERGDNLVITMLHTRKGLKTILKRLNDLLKDYKTVSWYGREHKKFTTKRRETCGINL